MPNPPTIRSVETSEATAIAQVERMRRSGDPFHPTAGGAFTHATTVQSTLIPADLVLGLTTSVSSGGLIIATTSLEDRINLLAHTLNKVVYILELNGQTS